MFVGCKIHPQAFPVSGAQWPKVMDNNIHVDDTGLPRLAAELTPSTTAPGIAQTSMSSGHASLQALGVTFQKSHFAQF